MTKPIVLELDLRNEPETRLDVRKDVIFFESPSVLLGIAVRADQRKALARLLAEVER